MCCHTDLRKGVHHWCCACFRSVEVGGASWTGGCFLLANQSFPQLYWMDTTVTVVFRGRGAMPLYRCSEFLIPSTSPPVMSLPKGKWREHLCSWQGAQSNLPGPSNCPGLGLGYDWRPRQPAGVLRRTADGNVVACCLSFNFFLYFLFIRPLRGLIGMTKQLLRIPHILFYTVELTWVEKYITKWTVITARDQRCVPCFSPPPPKKTCISMAWKCVFLTSPISSSSCLRHESII
jgi:hypothetical protein